MENENFKLPENAQRELKPGEEYEPILSKNKTYQEVTVWSVSIGLLMTILFSAAAAYLGLKVGQVFEAAIPIAIIAIGLTGLARKNDALSQNVIIQSIGGCSGGVVAGAISWFVSSRSKDQKLNDARYNRGTLIASGFIAGGALMGVVSAILKFANIDAVAKTAEGTPFAELPVAGLIALVMYIAIIVYMIWDSKRAKAEE